MYIDETEYIILFLMAFGGLILGGFGLLFGLSALACVRAIELNGIQFLGVNLLGKLRNKPDLKLVKE